MEIRWDGKPKKAADYSKDVAGHFQLVQKYLEAKKEDMWTELVNDIMTHG